MCVALTLWSAMYWLIQQYPVLLSFVSFYSCLAIYFLLFSNPVHCCILNLSSLGRTESLPKKQLMPVNASAVTESRPCFLVMTFLKACLLYYQYFAEQSLDFLDVSRITILSIVIYAKNKQTNKIEMVFYFSFLILKWE